MIELSAYIRNANRSLARALLPQQSLDFFCECDRPSCRERVRLTREEFDQLSANGAFLVAPAHSAADVAMSGAAAADPR